MAEDKTATRGRPVRAYAWLNNFRRQLILSDEEINEISGLLFDLTDDQLGEIAHQLAEDREGHPLPQIRSRGDVVIYGVLQNAWEQALGIIRTALGSGVGKETSESPGGNDDELVDRTVASYAALTALYLDCVEFHKELTFEQARSVAARLTKTLGLQYDLIPEAADPVYLTPQQCVDRNLEQIWKIKRGEKPQSFSWRKSERRDP